jgi:preprotein translocase subunit SecG
MSKFCKNCGKPLNDDVKFCNYCGFNQDNDPPAQPQSAQQPNPQTNSRPGAANQAAQKPKANNQATPPPPPPPNPPAPKQKGGCLKKILMILAGFFVVIILIGSCMGPSKDKKDTNTKPATTTSTSKDNAAKNSDSKEKPKKEDAAKPKKSSVHGTNVKANAMLQEFIDDQKAASEKYAGQTFNINGQVKSKGQYNNDNAYYTIISSKEVNGKLYAIGISYSEKQADKVNQIKEGDFVNVECKCHGLVKQENPNHIYIQMNAITIFDF